MEFLWRNGPSTGDVVRAAVSKDRALTDSTIRTVLRRLEGKQYVKHEMDGRQFIYSSSREPRKVAAEAVRNVNAKGRKVRLVSMPSTNTYELQDDAYKQSVLPSGVTRRVAVEAAARETWWRYVGLQGQVVGIDHFGASAPAKVLFAQFGFTAEKVIEAVDKTGEVGK